MYLSMFSLCHLPKEIISICATVFRTHFSMYKALLPEQIIQDTCALQSSILYYIKICVLWYVQEVVFPFPQNHTALDSEHTEPIDCSLIPCQVSGSTDGCLYFTQLYPVSFKSCGGRRGDCYFGSCVLSPDTYTRQYSSSWCNGESVQFSQYYSFPKS